MLTNERPYEVNPQAAEILRLENLAESHRQLIADRDREVRELQSRIREIQTSNELALSRTWEIRLLKRVLRVIVVIAWFALVIFCLAGPPYLYINRHAPPEMYALFIPGLILGGLFWSYIHTREQ
jgi:hypothetical protein